LLTKYNAHINVEVCNNICAIKYLFTWSQKWRTFISTFKKYYIIKVKWKNKTMPTYKTSSSFIW
jgi:hypothetical protein